MSYFWIKQAILGLLYFTSETLGSFCSWVWSTVKVSTFRGLGLVSCGLLNPKFVWMIPCLRYLFLGHCYTERQMIWYILHLTRQKSCKFKSGWKTKVFNKTNNANNAYYANTANKTKRLITLTLLIMIIMLIMIIILTMLIMLITLTITMLIMLTILTLLTPSIL